MGWLGKLQVWASVARRCGLECHPLADMSLGSRLRGGFRKVMGSPATPLCTTPPGSPIITKLGRGFQIRGTLGGSSDMDHGILRSVFGTPSTVLSMIKTPCYLFRGLRPEAGNAGSRGDLSHILLEVLELQLRSAHVRPPKPSPKA